jgi:hypothetical protein
LCVRLRGRLQECTLPAVLKGGIPTCPPLPAGFTSEQKELLGPMLKSLSTKLQVGGSGHRVCVCVCMCVVGGWGALDPVGLRW